MTFSILIPSWNGITLLDRCLASVCRLAPAGAQILVVDDGSTDGTPAWLARRFPQVEVLALPRNGGFCQAVNAGLQHIRGDIVELLNNDTEVTAGWAEACLPHFHDAAVGSVAPLVLRMAAPEIIDGAGQEYHLCGWARDRGFGQRLSPEYLRGGEVFGPCASSGFYRREALLRVGGLLPEFEAYLDDVDLSFRLRWAGYRSIYEPLSRVFHSRSASYGRYWPARVVRLISRNEELVWWNNLPARELFLSLPAHLAFLLVRLMRSAALGRLGPFLQGKIDALRAATTIRERRRQVRELAATVHDLHLNRGWNVLGEGWRWLSR